MTTYLKQNKYRSDFGLTVIEAMLWKLLPNVIRTFHVLQNDDHHGKINLDSGP